MKDEVKPSIPSSDEVVATPTAARCCGEDSQRDLKYVVCLDEWPIALIKLGYKLIKVELPPKM
jgi:hypothetical protein